MPALPLSPDLADIGPHLRGDHAPETFLAEVRAGASVWAAAIAAIDAGSSATDVLETVVPAFVVDPRIVTATRAAAEVVELGVASPADRFLVALCPARRELRRTSNEVGALLRKAASMERRAGSRWRGTSGREAVLVDRDLYLEEVRIAARALIADAGTATTAVRGWLAAGASRSFR